MPSRRLPRDAVALDTQQHERRVRGTSPRTVLLVGELAARLRAELVERGAELTAVELLHDAFELLAERPFDVVVVNPHTEGCGLDLVSAIKEDEVEHQLTIATLYGARGVTAFLRSTRPPELETLEAARARHRVTPFIVLPVDEGWEYAVIVVPPHLSSLEDVRRLPLVTSIMTVAASKSLSGALPMA